MKGILAAANCDACAIMPSRRPENQPKLMLPSVVRFEGWACIIAPG